MTNTNLRTFGETEVCAMVIGGALGLAASVEMAFNLAGVVLTSGFFAAVAPTVLGVCAVSATLAICASAAALYNHKGDFPMDAAVIGGIGLAALFSQLIIASPLLFTIFGGAMIGLGAVKAVRGTPAVVKWGVQTLGL